MRAATLSAVVYLALAALVGRDVLGALDSTIASDSGDPLLNAALLTWNAQHVPFTDAWWQFPIFHPARDVLAFSEHLLGLSVIAAPLYWISGSTLAAYNATLLLTYPLCALAMYALAFRLTRSAAAAFLAGLAFGFAPVRVAQLPHLQILATFYLALALAGLHAYLDTHRRRWLALFGVSWMLQGAATGYLLLYGSVLIGFWLVWFVVVPGRWRELRPILATLALAALPLAPILYRYSAVHARHGFFRGFSEAGLFGADITSMLCAPANLTFWGWLRVGCRAEGELFPGVALVVLCVIGGLAARGSSGSTSIESRPAAGEDDPGPRLTRRLGLVRYALLSGAVILAAIALVTLASGPWRVALGPLHASASSPVKPFSSAMGLLLTAALLSPRLWAAARRSSVRVFYVLALAGTWVLALGPEPGFLGTQVLYQAPFAWLMRLPGGDAVRVPARFWFVSLLCLAALLAILMAELLKRRSRCTGAAIVLAAACGLVADGWARIPVSPAPPPAPDPAILRGGVVLELPLGEIPSDIAAAYRAVTGGWRTVNGYSGYEPADYGLLRAASKDGDDAVLAGLVERGGVHVLVSENAPDLERMVARHRGSEFVARANGLAQYRITADRVAGAAFYGAGSILNRAPSSSSVTTYSSPSGP